MSAFLQAQAAFVRAEETAEKIEQTRAALEKWVETERIISREKHDFALAEELFNERIVLLRREIEALRGKIVEAEAGIAEADKKRAALIEANERLQRAAAALGETLTALETRTRHLLRRLPDPLRERVRPLSQRLPENPAETKLSRSERFQNVVGILNEVNKFNREITVINEVRTLPDGSAAEVTALYLGLGQAYFVTADGNSAGCGFAGEDGWVWQAHNAAAPRIASALAILKNEAVAAYVQLPMEIR